MAAKAGARGSAWRNGCVAIFALLVWMLIATASADATTLPTTITENTTLTVAGGPYTGTSTIEAGVTVKVEPGVKFTKLALTIKGTLNAEGTSGEPIVVTESSGNYAPLLFEPGSGASVLNHLEITKSGSETYTKAPIRIVKSSPTIKNSTLSKDSFYAIYVPEGGSPEIANNTILNSGSYGGTYKRDAIRYNAGTEATGAVDIHGNYVEKCGGGIEVSAAGSNTTSISLGGNTVVQSESNALSYAGPVIPDDITENTLTGNTNNYIQFGGTITHSLTWNAGSRLRISGGLTIASGATLTMTVGVYVINPNITVKGTLLAEGTSEEPIVFTESSEKGKALLFEPGSGASVLSHVEVSYAGSETYTTPSIKIVKSSPTIVHSTIRRSGFWAIYAAEGGSPEIAYNKVLESGQGGTYKRQGIYYNAYKGATGAVNIHDNLVEKCGGGITVSVSMEATVTGQTLRGNTVIATEGNGLTYSGPDIPGDVTENMLEGNVSDDIQIAGTVGHSETWSVGGSPARVTGAGIVVPAGINLNLQPGVYIRSPKMIVYGTLHAEGSADRPIALTGPSEEKNGEWSGISFEAGSGASVLRYVEVGFGGSTGPMLNVKGVSPTITNSTFRRSSGDAILVQQSGQPIIEGNRFRDNHFGLRYEGEGKLHAPNNDWGCANGPKPTGCGDEVSSNVEWQPGVVLQELPRLCPGTTMLATSTTCLLQKYEPQLRYDSEENYYADSSAEITDNWGDEAALDGKTEAGRYSNVLVDESEWPNSPILAYASPFGVGGSFPLTRSALGTTYPTGHAADEADWLVEGNEYVRDAHRLEAAGYLNAAYAHAYTDANGKRWLEYWYWYYYNPKDFGGVGKHEGDWETVIVGLDANNRPEEVIFSQHDGASNCYIGDVEQTEEGGPVVYVGLDSHAGYEKPGVFWATGEDDWADGAGPSAQPGLTIIGASPPSWILWPGHWGHTQPEGGVPGQATSPQGPYFHEAWSAPDAYAANAFECTKTAEEEGRAPLQVNAVASSTSSLGGIGGVTVVGRRPMVTYKVPKATGHGFWPRLRISVNELGDGGIPPVSKTISNVKAQGRITVPIELKAGRAAEVLGSIVYKNGRRVHLAHRIVRIR